MDIGEARKKLYNLDRIEVLFKSILDERLKISGSDAELKQLESDLSDLKKKREQTVAETSYAIGSEMNKVITSGSALFEINEDGSLKIGLVREDGNYVPFRALSGGEKVIFKAALAYSLGPDKIIIIEAAEIDSRNLKSLIKNVSKDDERVFPQTIINTWQKPYGKIPDYWNVVEIKEEDEN